MQTRHESILRTINNTSKKYNILTFPTHEAYQSNLGQLPHTFYLFQGEGIKSWSSKYRQLPQNHILLDGSPEQIKPDMKFDIVLSQNKFGQFTVAEQLSKNFNVPLVSIEHTLPFPQWSPKHRRNLTNMRGDINVFISDYSINEWGFEGDDPTVRVIHHGIDTGLFKPDSGGTLKNVLCVVNDWINRDWCCGWSIFNRVIGTLPVTILGDTKGLSEPAKDINHLVKSYNDAGVFLNTSTISPVPTALLEAMSCGCPVVSTATCMIPEIIENGVNGFISNDEGYIREKLEWCLKNPEEARDTIGKSARETIQDKFCLECHLEDWNKVFNDVYGTALNRD